MFEVRKRKVREYVLEGGTAARLSWELDPVGAAWRGQRGVSIARGTASPTASHAPLTHTVTQ